MSLSFLADSVITTDISINSQVELSLAEGLSFEAIFNTDTFANATAPDGAFMPIAGEHTFVEDAFDHLDDADVQTEGQGVVTGGAGGFDFVVNVFDADGNLQQINPLEEGFNLEAAEIAAIATAALENWGTFINGAEGAVIEVSLTVDQLAPGTVASAGATGFFLTEGGFDNFIDENGNGVLDDFETVIIETNTALELQTGIDPVEGNFDLVINVNTDFLDSFSVDTVTFDPVTGEASVEFLDDVPDGTLDLFSVLSHEVGHGLGFLGLRSVLDGAGGGGTLPLIAGPNGGPVAVGTLFDLFTEVDSSGTFATFNGPATLAAYGEPVLIETSTGSPGSDFSHFAAAGDTALALLNPFVIPGERVDVGGLELAVFADLGFDVDIPADLPLVNQSDFFEPFRDFFPTLQSFAVDIGATGVSISAIADVGSPFGGIPASIGISAGGESARGIFDVFGTPDNNIATVDLSLDLLAPEIDLRTFVGETTVGGLVDITFFNPVNAGLPGDTNEITVPFDFGAINFIGDTGAGNTITGTGGADIVLARGGDDIVNTGAGDDSIVGGGGDDTVNAGAGNDSVNGGAGNDTLAGNAGNDDLLGGAGDDAISGGSGDDTIAGGTGIDDLFGGAGDDDISGGAGDDTIFGNAGLDTLLGGAGNDTLNGGGGDDELLGGAGDDTLLGGAGDDDLLGGAGDDGLTGGAGNDTLNGGAGSDTLTGGAGEDILLGGQGDDTLLGGADIDQLFGGGGDDFLAAGAGGDILDGGFGEDTLVGSGGDDLLFGGQSDDTLFGGADSDTLVGGEGDDTLNGGDGADIFVFDIDASTDTVVDFAVGEDTVLASGATGFSDLVITQEGDAALIQVIGDEESGILLEGVDASTLTEDSFIFDAGTAGDAGDSLTLSGDTDSDPALLSLVDAFVGADTSLAGETEAFAFNAEILDLITDTGTFETTLFNEAEFALL